MPPCFTLSIIRCGSRVKWSNPGKGVAPSPTPWCSSYWKGTLWVTLDYSRKLYFLLIPRALSIRLAPTVAMLTAFMSIHQITEKKKKTETKQKKSYRTSVADLEHKCDEYLVWFLYFNGISTFVSCIMPKPSFSNSSHINHDCSVVVQEYNSLIESYIPWG